MIRRPLVLAAALVCAMAGCGRAFVLRAPGAPREWKRIAAGPAVVSVVEFDGSGSLKPRADWTYDATMNVDAAVAARVQRAGGRTFVPADVAHTDVTSDDFRHWSSRTLQEIAGRIAGTHASGHKSVGEWRYPESLTTWRAALGADFALTVLFIDAYESAGDASSGAAASRYDAAQTGIACLVDLGDGRVVACATSTHRFGDLRTAEPARAAVADLADRICP
jgi:hypothetical protein